MTKTQKKMSVFLILAILVGIAVFTILHEQHGGSLFPTMANQRQSRHFAQESLYEWMHDFELLDDGVIQATSNDPWILLYLDPNIPGHVLHIHISDLSDDETVAQVYFSRYEWDFSESDSILFTLRDGINTVMLPRSNNLMLRLDLTSTPGVTMIVDEVVLSSYTVLPWQFWLQFSVSLLVLIAILWLLFFRTAFVLTQLRRFVPDAASFQSDDTGLNPSLFSSFVSLKKLNMVIVVVSTLALRFIPLMQTFPISSVSEELGSLFLAARLAGLEWLYIGGVYTYPGQVYNAIFAPLFMWTDDPFSIYLSILLFNAALVTVFSLVIYSIAVIYCKLPDRYPTALIVAFCSGVIFTGDAHLLSNDVPVFLTVWLTALMLLIAINAEPKKKLFATLGLTVVLFAGLIMNPWFVVPVIVIGLVALLYILVHKVWIITPWIFYPVTAIFLVISGAFNLFLAREISYMSFGEIVGAAFAPAQLLQHGFSPFTWFYTIITNVTALFVHTHGLAVIAFIIFSIILCRLTKRIFIRHVRSDENIGLPRELWVIMFVFASSVILSLSGTHCDVRGMLFSMFGPLLLITFGFLYNNIKIEDIQKTEDTHDSIPQGNNRKLINMCFAAMGVFTVTYIYVIFWIMPATEGHLRYGHIDVAAAFLPPFSGGSPDLYATFVVTIGFFAALYFALRKQKPLLLIIPVYAFIFSISASFVSAPFFNVVPPGGRTHAIYNELKSLDETAGLPDRIYMPYGTSDYVLQFMFSRHTLVSRFPDSDEREIIYIGTHFTEYASYLRDMGFYQYLLPNNLGLWIRGDDMRAAFAARAAMHNVIDPRIAYLIEASDVENVYISPWISSVDNLWVFQSVFSNTTVNPFDNSRGLLSSDMADNVVVTHMDDNIFLFSTRALLGELVIVTENSKLIDAVLSLGGEIDTDHDTDVFFFEPDNFHVRTSAGASVHGMPWLAPGDSLSIPSFALPAGNYEVSVIGHGLTYADFRVQYAHMLEDSVEFDNFHSTDYAASFSFELEYYVDFVQLFTNNDNLGFVRVDGIELRRVS